MKNPIESSVVSRTQSEANTERGKLDLFHGTTTKLDSFFPIFDQICYKSHIPNVIYYIATIYLYYQIFFSSIYPLNKYWFEINDDKNIYSLNAQVIEILTYLEKSAWFFHVEDEQFDTKIANKNQETNLMIPTIVMAGIFAFSICAVLIELFGASKLHKIRKLSFYILRFILDIVSPVMIIPCSSLIGISIRNLVLFKDKLNWAYLFCGLIMYIIFIIYTYISLTILTHSTCISKTLLSSFNIRIPLLLPTICSLFVICQCVFSLFSFWAMLVIQMAHLVVSVYAFWPMIYMIFHTKAANIIFAGVTFSTWINDIILLALHIIQPPTKRSKAHDESAFYFFYIAGLILPLVSLVLTCTLSFLLFNLIYKKILKELTRLSDLTEEIDNDIQSSLNNSPNASEYGILNGHRLFKNENSSLMSIHISFFNCLPLFYKWTAINYSISVFPTKRILIQSIQYLSFFPGMSRKLNIYLKTISQSRDLNYHQRFLLFQVYHIKMMRQSSVSPDANRRLAELKNASAQVYEDIFSFWEMKSAKFPYLEMISNETWKLDSKWEEAIRDFPNFQKFSDEYCSYLIECQMDLERAIIMKHRANLIELGRNFTIDVPFKCLAKYIPMYLKNGIVDFQGSFRNKQKDLHASSANTTINSGTQNSSTSTTSTIQSSNFSAGSLDSSGSSSSMLSSNYNLDPEFEESLGKQLFKQTALRLEMHRSLAKRKSYASILLLIAAYFVLICGCALFVAIYLYIDGYIVDRSDTLKYMNLASKSRFYLDLAVLGTNLKFAYFTNRFTALDLFNALDLKDNLKEAEENKQYNKSSYSGYDSDMFHINSKISNSLIHRNCMISRDSFHQLIDGLCTLGQNGESIYTLARTMMYNYVPFYTCYNGIPGNKVFMSLKSLEAYMHLIVEMSAAKKVEEGSWYNSDEVCEIFANQNLLELSSIDLFQTLMEHEVTLCEIESKFINVFSLTFPFVPIIIFFLPILLFIRLFMIDATKMVNLLLNASPQAKEAAKTPIQKESTLEVTQTTEKKPKIKHLILLRILLFVFCCLSALAFYFMLTETRELNDDIIKLGRWNLLCSVRMASTVETMNYVLSAVILNGSSSLNIPKSDKVITTREKMIELARASIVVLTNSNEALLKGHALVSSSKGFDTEFDKINIDAACESSGNNTDFHDSYRCSSAAQGVGIFISMIESIIEDIDQTNGQFENEHIIHSLHMLNRHLIARLEQAVDRLHDVNIIICKSLETKALVTFILGLITTILTFVVVMVFYIKSISIYGAGMVLAQRLPPSSYASDKKLMNFLLHKKESKNESEMPIAQGVIYMSTDAIICTNMSGVIEIINPAVTNILGYTPDQMLGQHISTFFVGSDIEFEEKENQKEGETNEEKNDENNNNKDNNNNANPAAINDCERIKNQLELMKNGQSALVFEDHFICLTDDDQDMPCGVTILGMTNGSSNSVESYVLIIRDETQLMEQQKAAEAAKARSENLLFHILPRDIVVRLNSGEKDISFTVQSASIIFTDVVKFSEYAAGLSPQQIMGSLSTLFAAFDACAKKYELITKIKLIGDIYMAAAGLFSDDIAPNEHAEQILKFGLDCLIELDDVNLHLSANLQLRVGVNSGGPLLAGVLGTDKPVFDIIGDPINVAARLQTTDIPGKVQIPKSTYDLVCGGVYSIEERGDVYLKGKGKTKAYLVSPFQNNTLALLEPSSSQEIPM